MNPEEQEIADVINRNLDLMFSSEPGGMARLRESIGGCAAVTEGGRPCWAANFVFYSNSGNIRYFGNPQSLPVSLRGKHPSGTYRIAVGPLYGEIVETLLDNRDISIYASLSLERTASQYNYIVSNLPKLTSKGRGCLGSIVEAAGFEKPEIVKAERMVNVTFYLNRRGFVWFEKTPFDGPAELQEDCASGDLTLVSRYEGIPYTQIVVDKESPKFNTHYLPESYALTRQKTEDIALRVIKLYNEEEKSRVKRYKNKQQQESKKGAVKKFIGWIADKA